MESVSILSRSQRHIVLVGLAAAVGHLRPFCSMAAHMVKLRTVFVTLFTTETFHQRVEEELARSFNAEENETRMRLRVVALPSNEASSTDMGVSALFEGFEIVYQNLIAERPITCAATSIQFPGIASPNAVVMDVFASKVLATVRAHSKNQVKVFCWVACSAAAYHQHFGMASPNKNGAVYAKIKDQMARTGRSFEEIAREVFFDSVKGDVVVVPGLPPMYDHEEHPQITVLDQTTMAVFRTGAAEVTDGCDGLLIATPQAIETPETLASLLRYYEGKVYAIGPLFATGTEAGALEKSKSEDSDRIIAFMDRALESHGPRSLVYISLGSNHWPIDTRQIWAFLDVVMERKIPFILAHASPFASIPADADNKVKQYGLGLLSSWCPQQYILSHSAVGWFVSHCGFNSVLESLDAGIPMICWPFVADQPANALHVVSNLGVGYELLEVRTGPHGLKPAFRTGMSPVGTLDALKAEAHRVFELAFGSDGMSKRNNAKALSKRLAQAWDNTDDGLARIALERFLSDII